MTSSDFIFYTAAEYWAELPRRIAKTKRGDRIVMMVMSIQPAETIVGKIIHELVAAATRGVEVYLSVDALNFIINIDRNIPGPLWFGRSLTHVPAAFKLQLDALESLRSQPTGHVVITNKPKKRFSLPQAGRSHIKYTVINDDVFIGGCNLQHTSWLDLMVEWHDKATADYLFDFAKDVHQTESPQVLMAGQDRKIVIDSTTTLYIDSGKRNQSVILEKALELIDSAEKSLIITCQYFPNSITAQHITAAYRRGVEVEVIYGHPSKQGFIGALGQEVSILRERLRVPPELFSKRLPKSAEGLHAKLIATEKGAMVGSHNYVRAGVWLGTAEIALLNQDPIFARDIVQKIMQNL
jgi:cardiolipin synthase